MGTKTGALGASWRAWGIALAVAAALAGVLLSGAATVARGEEPLPVVTATAANLTLAYGDPAPDSYGFTADGFVGEDTWMAEPICASTYVEGAPVGTYPIACGGGDAGPNYTVTHVDGVLTVEAAEIIVTADDLSLSYGDAAPISYAFTPSGFVGLDTWVSPPSCTSDYTATTPVAATPLPIVCTGGEVSTDYVITSYVHGALTIGPAPITVTAHDDAIAYGDPVPDYAFTDSGFVGADNWLAEPLCTSDYSPATPVTASPLPITCSLGDPGANYTVVSYAEGELAIGSRVVTVTARDKALTYGDPEPASYGFTTEGLLEGDTWTEQPSCTSSYTATTPVAESPLAITCTGGDAGANYAVDLVDGTLTVDPAEVVVTADDLSLTYGAAAPTDYGFTSSGFLGSDTWASAPTCGSAYTSSTSVATSPLAIVCTGGDPGANYVVADHVDGSLTISRKGVAVTATDVAVTYGDAVPAYSSTAVGFLESDTWTTAPSCTSAYTATSPVASSPMLLTCSGGDPGANYVVSSYTSGNLTIARKGVTVRASDASVTYGDSAPAYSSTTTGFLGSDTWTTSPTCSSGYTATTSVSASPLLITCTGGDPGANYVATSYTSGSLTIARKAVTATASNVARTYGDPVPTYTFTSAGFLGADTWSTSPACSSAYTATTAVASSPLAISCSGGNPGANYVASYAPGTLTISRKGVAVTASARTVTYGDAAPTYSSVATGFIGSDTWTTPPACASAYAPTTAVASSPVAISCTGGNPGANYVISSYSSAPLTILRKPVGITGSNTTVTYGNPEPLYGFAAGGLVNGDAWLISPGCDADYVPGTPAGTRAITCTGEAGDNYAESFAGATLTIAKRPLTVQANAPGKVTYTDPEPSFGFSIVSGGFAPGERWNTSPACDSNYAAGNLVGSYTATCTFAAGAVVNSSGVVTTTNYDLQANGRIFDVSPYMMENFDAAWYTGQNEYYTKSTLSSDGAVQAQLRATITGTFPCGGPGSVSAGQVTFVDGYTGYILAKNVAITEVAGAPCANNNGIAAAYVTLSNASDYTHQYKIYVFVTGSIRGDNFNAPNGQAAFGSLQGRDALVDPATDYVTLVNDPTGVNTGARATDASVQFLEVPSASCLSTDEVYTTTAGTTVVSSDPITIYASYKLQTNAVTVTYQGGSDTVTLPSGTVPAAGTPVYFWNISGTTGLSTCAKYSVINPGVGTFQVALPNALGTPIDLVGDGSGTMPLGSGSPTTVDVGGTGGTAVVACDLALEACEETYGQTLVTVLDPVKGGAVGSGSLAFLKPPSGSYPCGIASPWSTSLGQEGDVVRIGAGTLLSPGPALDTTGLCPTVEIVFGFNTERKTPKGNAEVMIPDGNHGYWLLKTNAVNTVTINATSHVATIFAKSNISHVIYDAFGSYLRTEAFDGNVTTQIDIYQTGNKVALTFIGSKTSILWWSNDWYKSGKKWLSAPQALLDGGTVSIT